MSAGYVDRWEAEAGDEFHRALLEASPNGIFALDVDTGRIVFANQEAARLVGAEAPQGLVGANADEFLPVEVAASAGTYLSRALTDGSVRAVEHELVRRDGGRLAIDSSAAIVRDGEAKPRFAVVVVRDISARRRAEDELRERMRQLVAVSGERQRLLARFVDGQEEERRLLASDIHDDTIQKMVVVAMRLELLAQHHPELAAEGELLELLASVREATRGLRRLIFELRPQALDHDGLVQALRLYLAEQSEHANGLVYALRAELSSDPPEQTKTTIYRLVQESLTNVRSTPKPNTSRSFSRSKTTGT